MKFLSIIFLFIFSFAAYGQSFTKNDLVVPKFSKQSTTFDKVKIWQAASQYKVAVTKSSTDDLALNGESLWRQGGFPLLKSYKIDELENKKNKPGKVLLKSPTEQILITFAPDVNVEQALPLILFKGEPSDFVNTEYFQALEKNLLPKIFTGKLGAVPFEKQRKLLKAFDYNLSSLDVTSFKEKTYLTLKLANTVIYNTIQVNQAERVARKTQEALKVISTVGKDIKAVPEIEGIKIVSEIHSKDFLRDKYTNGETEQFEMYVSFGLLSKFIDAEITNQDLIDGSIILVEGSRVKVNLTNYS